MDRKISKTCATKQGKIEFDKKTASHYSLSSDCEFGRYEPDSDDAETKESSNDRTSLRKSAFYKQSSKTLAEILSFNHANLSSVLLYLMRERGTQVIAQAAFLKGDYLETGKYNYCEDLEPLWLTHTTFFTGHVEQAIVAGLQIVYFFAKSGGLNSRHTAKDAEVVFSHNKREKSTRFDVFYKMNGHDTKLAIAEEGQESYISLYIKD